MNLMFSNGPSLPNRLALAILLSVSLIVFDNKFDGFGTTRVYLNSFVSPLQYLANLPSQLLNASANRFVSHDRLVSDNAKLTHDAMLMNGQLQLLTFLQQENDKHCYR